MIFYIIKICPQPKGDNFFLLYSFSFYQMKQLDYLSFITFKKKTFYKHLKDNVKLTIITINKQYNKLP